MTEWLYFYKHYQVNIRVGEIFSCLISINSPTRFARRGIISRFYSLSIVAVLLLRTDFSNPIHYYYPGTLQHEATTRFESGSAGQESAALSSVLSHPTSHSFSFLYSGDIKFREYSNYTSFFLKSMLTLVVQTYTKTNFKAL